MKQIYILIVYLLSLITINSECNALETLKTLDSKYTYSIILPSAYKKNPDKKFPAFFISSPSGKPGTRGINRWANEHDIMIILNKGTKNSTPNLDIKVLKSLMKTIEAKYRIHPFLRFSSGYSGGGGISAQLSIMFPLKWSGVIIQAHSGNRRYPPKHCAVAFIAGSKDTTHPLRYIQAAYNKLKAAGNPVHLKVYPNRGHLPALTEDVIKELAWMLNLKRYDHPAIDTAYIKSLKPELEKKIKTVLALTDSGEKIEEIKKMMTIPFLSSINGYKSMLAEYAALQLEYAESESDSLKAWLALIDVTKSDSMKNTPRNLQKKLLTKLRKLERTKEVLKEKGAMSKFYSIKKRQMKYLKTKRKKSKVRQKIISDYQALKKRYPDSLAAEKANEALSSFATGS